MNVNKLGYFDYIDFFLISINDQYMIEISKTFPKHICQFCGCDRKLVETLIDDEFYWDEIGKTYVPNGFTDKFEHTGNERCACCNKKWSGL
jgi:hypothetical protein